MKSVSIRDLPKAIRGISVLKNNIEYFNLKIIFEQYVRKIERG
ncbi:MAG: hypothetical protein PHO74_04580 [Weeksellaceae bacterium]|nr:hypothetical protein [Weeksellaceae bacterium]